MSKPSRAETIQIAFRVDEDTAAAIDREVDRIEALTPGVRANRAVAARTLLHRGIAAPVAAPVVTVVPAVTAPAPAPTCKRCKATITEDNKGHWPQSGHCIDCEHTVMTERFAAKRPATVVPAAPKAVTLPTLPASLRHDQNVLVERLGGLVDAGVFESKPALDRALTEWCKSKGVRDARNGEPLGYESFRNWRSKRNWEQFADRLEVVAQFYDHHASKGCGT